MIFEIVQPKKNIFFSFFYLSEIIGFIVATMLLLYSVLYKEPLFSKEITLAILFSFFFFYSLKEQFLMPKLYANNGYIKFGKKVEIEYNGTYNSFDYLEITNLNIDYYSYRHWLNEEYIYKKERGINNEMLITTKENSFSFYFLSNNENDNKKLKNLSLNLKRNGIAIKYSEKGEILISKERKISN